MDRLILDTVALIDLERQGASVIDNEADLAIATVTFAELRHGLLAATDAHRESRAQFVADVEQSITILPYTKSVAEEHSVLLNHVRMTGTPRGAHDLIIAAHARATGRVVVTRDVKARFGELPGVRLSGDE